MREKIKEKREDLIEKLLGPGGKKRVEVYTEIARESFAKKNEQPVPEDKKTAES